MKKILGDSLFMAIFFCLSCSEKSVQPNSELASDNYASHSNLSGEVHVAVRLPKIVIDNVSRVEYSIAASDMAELKGLLTIENDTAKGTVKNIPPGNNRVITLSAFNATNEKTYSGSDTIDVKGGQTVSARILMKSTQLGEVEVIASFNNDVSPGINPLSLPAVTGLKVNITSPADGARVPRATTVRGNVSGLPAGYSVRVFVRPPLLDQWWAQGPVSIASDGTWSRPSNIGIDGDADKSFEIIAAAVTEAQASAVDQDLTGGTQFLITGEFPAKISVVRQ